jgi:hypothetical protein
LLLDDDVDINIPRETIRENIKTIRSKEKSHIALGTRSKPSK